MHLTVLYLQRSDDWTCRCHRPISRQKLTATQAALLRHGQLLMKVTWHSWKLKHEIYTLKWWSFMGDTVSLTTATTTFVVISDVKSSRPKWPWGQNCGISLGLKRLGLGLSLKALASASNIWPRPGLDLVVLLCNRAFLGQKSCKIREFC